MDGQSNSAASRSKPERAIARELAYLLAHRLAGFSMRAVSIAPSTEGYPFRTKTNDAPDAAADAPQSFELKDYLQKRMLILCSRAYADALLLRKDKRLPSQSVTADEFLKCLQAKRSDAEHPDDDDFDRALEIATLYWSLVAGDSSAKESDQLVVEKAYRKTIYDYLFKFGLKPLRDFLTEKEFFTLLEETVQREVNSEGEFRTSPLVLAPFSVAEYTPGNNEFADRHEDRISGEASDINDTPHSTQEAEAIPEAVAIAPAETFPEPIRCLFAHELGHWLTATRLNIGVGDIELTWARGYRGAQGHGHCEMLLGQSSVTLGYRHYVERRIAVLCAGPLADCYMQRPNERGIGSQLYATFKNKHGTGRGDFAKASELIPIYQALSSKRASTIAAVMDHEPDRTEVLTTVKEILLSVGMWNLIQSDKYKAFAHKVIEAEQHHQGSPWQPLGKTSHTIPNTRLLRYAAREGLLDSEPNVEEPQA